MSLEGFTKSIEQHVPGVRLSGREAAEGFHNLSGFMALLIKINEREQIVPTKTGGGVDANQ